jgi:hypothetical protein
MPTYIAIPTSVMTLNPFSLFKYSFTDAENRNCLVVPEWTTYSAWMVVRLSGVESRFLGMTFFKYESGSDPRSRRWTEFLQVRTQSHILYLAASLPKYSFWFQIQLRTIRAITSSVFAHPKTIHRAFLCSSSPPKQSFLWLKWILRKRTARGFLWHP